MGLALGRQNPMLNHPLKPIHPPTTLPAMTRSMFSPEARFFTVESMPLVWDESQLWLMGREGKVLSPDQEQPWTSAPGTAELTWEQWVGAVAESWQR